MGPLALRAARPITDDAGYGPGRAKHGPGRTGQPGLCPKLLILVSVKTSNSMCIYNKVIENCRENEKRRITITNT